jgi:hypothetical protein
MRLRKAVEALWKLSSLRGVIASDLERLAPFSCKIFQWIIAATHEHVEIMDISRRSSSTHASLHMNFQK